MDRPHARTRLARVASREALRKVSNSEYTIDFGNAFPGSYNRSIVGVSVEGIGFNNVHPNVPEKYSRFQAGGFSTNVPVGYYSVDELLQYLVAEDAALTSAVVNADGFVELVFTIPVTLGPGGRGGWYLLGFPEDVNLQAPQTTHTATKLPNLNGLQVAYLHSSVLVDSQHAFDGEGLLVSFMTHIPITVPFGLQQTYDPKQTERPSIAYEEEVTLRQVNFTLRDHDGDVVDVGQSDMWVVLRLWF